MAHCNLCNKNTRCSCKWGGCPGCWSTNQQVSFINDLLKFWVSRDLIKEKLPEVKWYYGKIDSFTYYEFLNGLIDEEKFNQAIEDRKSWRKKAYQQRVNEVVDTAWRVNPKKVCSFLGNSPWDRCVFCNSIRKYMVGKECPKYKENVVNADTENK